MGDWIISTIRFNARHSFQFLVSFLNWTHVYIYVHIFIIISNSIISKINKMKRRKGKDLLFFFSIIIYVRNKRGNSCKSKHFSELITKYRYLNDIELFIV